jgi:hypothetical protein
MSSVELLVQVMARAGGITPTDKLLTYPDYDPPNLLPSRMGPLAFDRPTACQNGGSINMTFFISEPRPGILLPAPGHSPSELLFQCSLVSCWAQLPRHV